MKASKESAIRKIASVDRGRKYEGTLDHSVVEVMQAGIIYLHFIQKTESGIIDCVRIRDGEERDFKPPEEPSGFECETVLLSRVALRRVLDTMDGEVLALKVKTDYPLWIREMPEEDKTEYATACIAPILDLEGEND